MSDTQGGDTGVKAEDVVPQLINLKVKDDADSEVYFKIKTTARLDKLMKAYANQQGRTPDSVRFFTPDGTRVLPDSTAMSLELEEGDCIDVHTYQTGGCELS